MKKVILSTITFSLLNTCLFAEDNIKTLKEQVRIKSLEVDLNLDIYKDQQQEYEIRLKIEEIKNQIPKEKEEIENYFKKIIKEEKNPKIKNAIILEYSKYIKEKKSPKEIQNFFEELLLENDLTSETLGIIYYELMKIGYKRYGNVKANYYYNILEDNFPNTNILNKAKKERINILIKENNLTKTRRIIIEELTKKNKELQLFLLVNLLDINLKLGKTKNTNKVLLKVLEELRFNKSEEAKELIKEITEIDQSKLDEEDRKTFKIFFEDIYNNSEEFVEEVVVPAIGKNIDTLLSRKEWKEANKKLLKILQYYLEDEEYRKRKLDYDITNYLMGRITFITLKNKYLKEENKMVKSYLEVFEKYDNLKNSEINNIKRFLEKLIDADVRKLNKYGLEKGDLIEESLKIYIKRFATSKKEDKLEAKNFFEKYDLIKNKYRELDLEERKLILKKVMKIPKYSYIKNEIYEELKKNENRDILDKYLYSMMLIDLKRWSNAKVEIDNIYELKPLVKEKIIEEEKLELEKHRILKEKEILDLEKVYFDVLLKIGNEKDIKKYIKSQIRRRNILDVGTFLDNLWKGFNYLKNKNENFLTKPVILRMINVSNTARIYSYRPEIDYELTNLILSEGRMYEFNALQILLNIEKNISLINKLNPIERQKLFYTIGEMYQTMLLGNSAIVYFELCKAQEKPETDIYTKLCNEKLIDLKKSMLENNINWQ